jgi:hypothetical protein
LDPQAFMAEVRTWGFATCSLANLWTVRALTIMSFSFSTFTVEIDGVPTIALRAKWYAEADDICRGWANLNWDEPWLLGLGLISQKT